ncbi:MAG: hypothetical protein ACYC5O_03890 [Anaerolineae bacterium]
MRRRAVLLAMPTALLLAGRAQAQAPGGATAALFPAVANGATLVAHLGYGANVASPGHASYLSDMGFDWAKGFVRLNPALGAAQDFGHTDNLLREFLAHGVFRVLLRIDAAQPPTDGPQLAGFAAGAAALAAHVRATWGSQGLAAVAYEVWNEPNLDYEWRGGAPDPARYTALLQASYVAIKGADAAALVISGGLATTGDGVAGAYGDLAFIRGMYQAGAKGYLDALGSHPYGGPCSPEEKPGVLCFRRAEDQRRVMVECGDGQRQMWATEFGWIVQAGGCNLGEHQPSAVSEAVQAEYLARAYRYADARWPWMGAMFVFCLDFGVVEWYADCDPVRWYSLLHRADRESDDIVERPAYAVLRDMRKRYGSW